MGLEGRPVDRFGYLIVAIGAAATISHRTSQSRWLKKLGEIAYLLMTPPVTLGYRQRDVALAIDGIDQGKRRLFTAMIGNTGNGGGGMKLVPGARFDDGVLDLIEIGGMSRFDALLRIIPRLYSGTHVHHPKVRLSRGASFAFKSEVETLVDLDGETVAACRCKSRSCREPSTSEHLELARGPAAQHGRGPVIHREEALDAQLLHGDVLRRAERGDGGEEAERHVALAEMHRQHRGRHRVDGRGLQRCRHAFVSH
jgi:hypothetical protein